MKNKIFIIKTAFSVVFTFFTLSCFSQDIVSYDFSFTSSWNSIDHGTLPNSPHWSDLVGTTHNSDVHFWELGLPSTAGIKDVAEEGNNTNFEIEINSAIDKDDALNYLATSFSPFAAISTATLTDIEVYKEKPLLTLASMIAPSPDWFIGVDSFSLLDEQGNWKAQGGPITIDLFAIDAGTDSGASYQANNSPTTPVDPIASIGTQYGFNGNKIGTLTITFKGVVLSIEDELAVNKTPKIFPNPTNNLLTIDNLNNYNTIEMYDQIGRRVFKKDLNQVVSYSFNTNNYTNGLYFIKLINSNNSSRVNKILIQ